MPFINAGVFLSDPDLRCGFDEVQKANVYGRAGLEKQTDLPGVWDGLLGALHSRIDLGTTVALPFCHDWEAARLRQ